ncbi:phage capsid protein [Stutzerimonas stutzeri]|uniref:phage capsid protein n=1 Tax=Stutzerimonas stutzeri TaxID=316 RepID=UPI0003077B7E|nr:phage capsid protein [Stutzerimonas stutzeri]
MPFPQNQNVSFLGQQNLSGDQRALFMDLFAGEVITQFEQKNLMMDKHRVKTIKNGRSYEFPMVGTTGAKYHVPGEMIQADKLAHSKRRVTIDELLISPVFIDRLDEAMNHFDVRSIYTKECANALSNVADRNILRTAVKASFITDAAAATAAGLNPVNGETFTTNVTLGAAGDELKGDALVRALFKAREEFDKKDVTGEPFVILRPEQYYSLFNTTDTSKLFYMNKDVGGVGSIATASIPLVAGMKVYMSNHLPNANESTALAGDPESAVRPGAYRGDFSKVVGLVMTEEAIATVKLFDLATEMEYQIERQGTLIVAKYAMGHNILRPACAISILKV